MKIKNIIYGLLVCVCLSMQSCLFSEDELFDKSSAERENEAIEQCQNVLQSAANGWKLEYYFGEDGTWGACNLFAKFEDGKVTLASDVDTPNYAVGETSTSLYKVDAYQGIELSFDSYNELIHTFCEPNGYNDPGYSGDYEFIIRKIESDRIELSGKKHDGTLIMTALPTDLIWADYLESAAQIEELSDYGMFKIFAGEKEIVRLSKEIRTFYFSTIDENEVVNTTFYPFIYTDTGIKLGQPMDVEGSSVQNFTWDEEQLAFISNENSSIKIAFYCPEGYYDYIGWYSVQASGQSSPSYILLEEGQLGKTYTVQMGDDLELTVLYDMESDCINVMGQTIGTYRGYPAYMYAGEGNSFYATSTVGFYGKRQISNDGVMSISFTCNDQALTTWLFLYNNSGWYLFNRWIKPVFTKITE